MTRQEKREFAERERMARDLWQMVRTSLGNHAGHDNPYLISTLRRIEQQYPWLREERPRRE